MRFACQSCGKAYNLPEERISEKSNVKLKCRVCGAIVEVKRHGDVVATILTDIDEHRGGRVSEAPVPLASMSPDDPEDATAAIALSDVGYPSDLGLPPLPPPPATGFAMAPLPPPPRGDAVQIVPRSEPPLAPPLPPPGLMAMGSSAPPPQLVGSEGALDAVVTNGSPMLNGGPPALGGPALGGPALGGPAFAGNVNGTNAHAHFGQLPSVAAMADGVRGQADAQAAANAVALSNAATAQNLGGGAAAVTLTSMGVEESPSTRAEGNDTNKKMIAAFLTGVVVDRIISGLFF